MGVFRFLGRLVRAVWRGLDTLRRMLHLIILLAIFTVLLAGLLSGSVPVPSSAALVIDPAGILVEQLEGSPLDRALAELDGDDAHETLVRDVIDSIDQAATDKRIKAIVLKLDGLEGGGLAKLQTIARSLDNARASGKKVIAVGDSFTRDQYYLAARANEVIMHPLGSLYLDGYEYYRTFFKSALDKLHIDLNVFRVGEYKSFVEPFIRDDMSDEDREASRRWLTALWSAYERDVAKARKLTPEALDSYANDFVEKLEAAGGDAAKAALQARLVDKLMSRPEVDEYLIGLVGESDSEEGTYSAIDFTAYMRANRLEQRLLGTHERNVGIVIASGTIVDGDAPPGTVGGDTLAAELRAARLDDSIEAVILRVDSPGGSVFASEVIFDEVQALKAAGKPVIASMSSVAASGGYYVSMLADEIWASETTITGSIGVGALFPTVQRGLDKLGVHVDGFGTTRLSGQLRADRALGGEARRVLTASVEDAYRLFVGKVAESRGVTFEQADSVARGRVWIGSDAKDLGLIDRLGDLDDAIKAAASRAGLEEGDYGVRYVEPEMSLGERLAVGLSTGVHLLADALGVSPPARGAGSLVKRTLAGLSRQLGELEVLNDPRGLYYHCLCAVD